MKTYIAAATVALGTALFVYFPASSAATSPGSSATEHYIEGQGARFESLAGSKGNLSSLAYGLRTGTTVRLVEHTRHGTRVTTFEPATKPMGYGNITRALTLAQRQLSAEGITDPTAAQLRAALNGGTVRTASGSVQLQGVLNLRSSGMGWGKIAHTIGVAPGAAHSAGARTAGGTVPGAAGTGAGSTHAGGPSHGAIVSAAGTPRAVSGNASGNGHAYGQVSGPKVAVGPQVQTGIGNGAGNAMGHGHSGR